MKYIEIFFKKKKRATEKKLLVFVDEPETILKREKQSYNALLDSSKMMEEKQAGQFPKGVS